MGKRSAPAAYSPVAVGVTTTQQHQPPPSQLQQKRQATASDHEPATTSTLVPLDRRQANLASFSRGYHDRERRHHNEYAYDDDEDEDDVDYDDDEKNRDVVASPPRKTHRVQLHHQQPSAMIGSGADAGANRRSRLLNARAYTADRHSCLAVPYGANDARTTRYFDLVISKAKAPVVCAFAGKIKGKAIYADRDIEQSSRIWTEAPFVAMQHEANRSHLRCCQYCFVPLLSEYKSQWHDMAARWNAAQQGTNGNGQPVGDDELDLALQQLKVNRKNCGLAGPGATCSCGEVYCSKLCQIRAFHEYHSILCPRDDPYSAMNQFLAHMRHTNDIFLLVAKVIARLLSRFFTTRDIMKVREPMDMFYKKPWWEVVLMEKQIQHIGDATPMGMDVEVFAREYSHHHELQSQRGRGRASTSSDTLNGSDNSNTIGPKPAPTSTVPCKGLSANLDDLPRIEEGADEDGIEAHCLRELLTFTHQLLLDAIESNLVHLEREDQLHGLSVNDVWTSCASILSFEFFAAQLGLFEMNNVSMEIDHPFRGLIEILDPDVHAETDDPVVDENHVVNRVRRVLEHEEARLTIQRQQELQQQQQQSNDDAVGSHEPHPSHSEGFLGVEGTALFPIICTMNHSCEPNCTVLYTKDGNAHVVAVRDIRKGDELCICYIDIDEDVRTREANLREYQFKCFCSRCSDERRAIDLTVAQQLTSSDSPAAAAPAASSSRQQQQCQHRGGEAL